MIAGSSKFGTVLAALAVVVLSASAVSAQSGYGATIANQFKDNNSSSRYSSKSARNRLQRQSVTRNRFAPTAPPQQSSRASSKPKPFSTINRGPTVSPYLALDNPRSQISDYFNIVKPQREQRRLNQQQQRVNQQLQRENLINQHRLNMMAAEGPFNTTGSEKFAPTGHAAVHQNLIGNYMNTNNYFPPPSQGKDK